MDALAENEPFVGTPCAAPAGVLSKKKSFAAVERFRPENLARRRVFCALLTLFQLERFAFLDESYCATGMRRDFAWARRGRRALSTRPFGKWRTVSLIGAVRIGERPRLMTHRGAVNGQVFLRFVRRRLVPWLRKGDIVCLDNLGTHKVKGVREAIQAAGAIAIYLPPYSPDLNPIELWWADLKRQLRHLAVDTEQELRAAVRKLRASLPIEILLAWFTHCSPHLQHQ